MIIKNMSIIDTLKSKTLTFQQLQFFVGPVQAKRCRWLVYDDLIKFKNIDDLMALGAVIILLQIEKPDVPKVGHFIVILDHGTHYEHFDSYGITMDEELELTKEHHLTNIFKQSNKKIVDNNVRLQRFREDVNTCGRWVVARLLLRMLELDDFIKIFQHLKPQTPDEMVVVLTILLQFDK